jgi:hypothetical protein
VQFLDRTLLRLTDANERTSLFSPAVGNRVLEAAYIFHNVEVGDVTGVSVRDIELLPAVTERQNIDAAVIHPTTGMRWEASGTTGVLMPHAVADARIELFLTAETRVADTSVQRVETETLQDLADLDAVDARIVADDGVLPADETQLAQRRFSALKTMMHERFSQPDDFEVDSFFERKGITNVDALLAFLDTPHHPHRVELELVIDGTLPSRIVNHRVIAAVCIEENPVDRLHAVIQEIQVNRSALAKSTESAQAPSGMVDRTPLPFVLVFSDLALDDDDLPLPIGVNPADDAARRIARLNELQRRLVPFGIALAPITA